MLGQLGQRDREQAKINLVAERGVVVDELRDRADDALDQIARGLEGVTQKTRDLLERADNPLARLRAPVQERPRQSLEPLNDGLEALLECIQHLGTELQEERDDGATGDQQLPVILDEIDDRPDD